MKYSFMLFILACCTAVSLSASSTYTTPQNNRIKYNLNYDWKFNKADVANSQLVAFNDAAWKTVSLPHTYNDFDFFNIWITGSGHYGWAGKTWYRKHFKLDASLTGRKVFVEFEGIRQAGEVYINGTWVGRSEDGITPFGVDISAYVNFGAVENVLAVKVDNSLGYKEVATGVTYVWHTPPFNPDFGGIVSNVNLHVMDKIYQTLPLYNNLATTGTYVYATNINISARSADITVEAQVMNSNADPANIDYVVAIVDRDGNLVAQDTVPANSFKAGETKILTTTIPLTNVKFWSPGYPNLYKVYSQLVNAGKVLDVYQTPLGVRKVEFNAAEGLSINGTFLYLKGFAPRTTMEWVSLGVAPNWLAEYDFSLMKQTNANFLRPMHCGPRKRDVEAADKFGTIYACPAGDAEGDATGRQWDQRVEVMRDLTIYYRNNPSIVFFEGGNQHILPEHMQEMQNVRKTWDPNGGRFSGTRSMDSDLAAYEEYGSTMDGVGTSATIPIWDAEYARGESPRRVWDKYSPPSFGYKNIADTSNTIVEYPVDDFLYNSCEDLALNNVKKFNDRWSKRGGLGLNSIMCGGAKIIFADGVSHGRMAKTEVCRVSGVMDAARLPKESYYAMKAVQSDTADIELLGHWTYPAGTVKPVYVISNMENVSLATYDPSGKLIKDYGMGVKSTQFIYTFSNVAWLPGKIVATGYVAGVATKTMQILSAGAPAKLKLTPILGPTGFIADGNDVAMFDVEVVDANGIRVPTQDGKVSFTYSGQGTFLGGYNSGIQNSVYQDTLHTECGINRVFVRATRTAGDFTLNVTAAGLTSASSTISSKAFNLIDGLTVQRPQGFTVNATDPPIVPTFHFDDVVNAEVNTEITSGITTLSGVTTPQTIQISAIGYTATYSINGGTFTSDNGMVNNGDQLRVKLTSDTRYLTTRSAIITIGSTKDIFSITTKKAPLAAPNLALNKPVTASSSQTGNDVIKINDGSVSSRWAGATNTYPQSFVVDLLSPYKIDSTEFMPYGSRDYKFLLEGSLNGTDYFTLSDQTKNTLSALTVPTKFPAQTARFVRMTISGAATYTGGWASIYEFRVYEAPKDTIPDQFHIVPQTGADVFSSGVSAPFIVTGIDGATTISISNNTEIASYSVNNGLFTTDPSTVNNTDTIRVKLGTGSQYDNTYSVMVTIGGISDNFTITTISMVNNIEKLSAQGVLSFYPNPTTGLVKIVGIPEAGNLEIYNVAGQIVKSEVVKNTVNYQLDLSQLDPGMYLVKFNTNAKASHGQLIRRAH
ncbi:MAG: discoidin domain-containing protein [Bacteroidota bacterium]|nr:discoidin domain-containing protein [Bacteroidota bacterium]